MIRALLLLVVVLSGWPVLARGQTFSPQSSSGLSVSFTTERAGGSRILVFGDIRNATNSTYPRAAQYAVASAPKDL